MNSTPEPFYEMFSPLRLAPDWTYPPALDRPQPAQLWLFEDRTHSAWSPYWYQLKLYGNMCFISWLTESTALWCALAWAALRTPNLVLLCSKTPPPHQRRLCNINFINNLYFLASCQTMSILRIYVLYTGIYAAYLNIVQLLKKLINNITIIHI